jgi:malonyl CoA-acyl carrier protein transacylase
MTSYMFPGQGSQIKGMGEDLFDKYPELTRQASDILGYSIKQLCLEDKQRQLNLTQFTQPALYVVNALSYINKLEETGNKPDFVAGHSLGEYNALLASEAITFEGGLMLVKKRGELMSQAPKGAMAAVIGFSEEQVVEVLRRYKLETIDIANVNSPIQTVLSGIESDISRAEEVFEDTEASFVPLNTSGAFHSRYMAYAREEFAEYLKNFDFAAPKIPVIANVTAKPYIHGELPERLAEQITGTVKWTRSMQYLLDQGETEFEELGVEGVLTKLITLIREDYTPKILARVVSLAERSNTEPAQAQKEHQRSVESSQELIDRWNKRYPIGTQVKVLGYPETFETRSKGVLLFGHRAAIYMKGYPGYFALQETTPVNP